MKKRADESMASYFAFACFTSFLMNMERGERQAHIEGILKKMYPSITGYVASGDNLVLYYSDKSVFFKLGSNVLSVADIHAHLVDIGMFFFKLRAVEKDFGWDMLSVISPDLNEEEDKYIKSILEYENSKLEEKMLKRYLKDCRNIDNDYVSSGTVGFGVIHGKIPIDPEGIRLAQRKGRDRKVAEALARKTGEVVKLWDYVRWMYGEGEGNDDAIERIVVKLLGKKAYDTAKYLGRLPELLLYALELGPASVQVELDLKALLFSSKV